MAAAAPAVTELDAPPRVCDDEMEAQRIADFMERADLFAGLGAEQRAVLARRLERVSVPAGAAILRQGERGDTCYLLYRGSAEVWLAEEDGAERRLAQLTPGALFGEMALLTDAPRTASVRACEPSELLVLHRSDLLAVMTNDAEVRDQVIRMAFRRARPRRVEGVIIRQQAGPDGETITILKHPEWGTYFRLSEVGWFIWQRLNGQRSVRDLAVDVLLAFKAFNPETIGDLLAGLIRTGFAVTPELSTDVPGAQQQASRGRRGLLMAQRLLEWRLEIPNVDTLIGRLYAGGGWLLGTRPALALMTLVVVVGACVFVAESGRVAAVTAAQHGGERLLLVAIVLPGTFGMLVCHELAHAFATKAFGQTVRSAGFGWYWFSPMVFVNNSDIWLAPRWPRAAVSLAGPAASLLAGSAAALAAALTTDPLLLAGLWQLAVLSYVVAVQNLNPLFESDGYFALADWLDRPNLRRNALAHLGGLLGCARPRAPDARGHRFDCYYGLASLAYFLVMGGLTVVSYRGLLQGWLAEILPGTLAVGMAWALALLFIGLTLAGIAADLSGKRRAVNASV